MTLMGPIKTRTGCVALAAIALIFGMAAPSRAVPSFARQTGMACAACHTVFPELTPFGREFKLNGYVLDNMKQVSGIDTSANQTLSLNSIPPLSLMLQVSYTRTKRPVPDSVVSGALAKNGDLLFPQQASFFYAGKIADGLGAFLQLTYDGAEDHFGFDNTDVRYAHHWAFGGTSGNDHSLIVGLTLNNNPTVQDPWNTTPAWGFPYANSSTAPGAITSAKIDSGAGGLGQSVGGLGVYAWLDSHFYAEITGYSSAITGGSHPLDSTQANVAHAVAPYWRVAYEQRWDRHSLEIGAYGLTAHDHPGNGQPLSGPTDKYRDAALDAQYQFIGEDHLFTALATYIDEHQTLNASVADGLAANVDNDLKTLKLAGEYYYKRKIGGSIGYFRTTGSSDPLLYAAATLTGSANFSPDTTGYVAEVNYLPWLNVKLQLQHTGYSKFNGGKTNYDGTARAASDNDTTYLLVWLNY